MERFFKKYPYELGNYQAIKMIKEKLTEACKAEEEGKPYEHHLLESYEMLSDLLEDQGLLDGGGQNDQQYQQEDYSQNPEYGPQHQQYQQRYKQYANGSSGVGGNNGGGSFARGTQRTR